MDCLKCIKGVPENFAFIDFVALDYYNDSHNCLTLQSYADKIKKEVFKINNFGKIFEIFNREISKNEDIVRESNTLQAGIDNYDFYHYKMKGIRRKSDIFPLIKLRFEDVEFYAPNNPHEYLKTIFDNYQKFPADIMFAKHEIN